MDFVYILRELWRQRIWLLLGLIVSCLIGLAVGFRLSLFPLKLGERTVSYGTAATKVVVDTVPSALTEVSDDGNDDYDPLITRAGVYAELFSSTAVRRAVSLYSGIPADSIVVDVPSAGRIIGNQGGPQTQATETERSVQIAGEDADYRLEVDVETNLPVLAIAAEAPDQEQALRLANGAAEGLRSYLRELAPKESSGRPIQVRRLGNAQGGSVRGRTGLTAAVAITAGVFIAWCLLVLALTTISRRWGELDLEEEDAGGSPPSARRADRTGTDHAPLTGLPPDDVGPDERTRVGSVARGSGADD